MLYETKILGPLCEKVGSGVTPRGGDAVYILEGVGLIRSQNVYNFRFEYSGLAHIDEQQAHKMRGVTVLPQDVLLNITGDSVARSCIVPDDVLPARVNQHVAIVRPDHSQLRPQFLKYLLVSPSIQTTLLSLAGSGGTRKALTKDMIEGLRIPAPDPATQDQIVEILLNYDKLIENNRRRVKLLETAARLIYREWFTRFRFPGFEHTEITNGIPDGWLVKPLSELVVKIKHQVDPKKVDGNTKYIGLEHIPRRQFTLNEWGEAEDVTSTKFRFEERDILFGKIRPYFHKVGFALCNGITSSDAIVIRPIDSRAWAYSLLLLSSDSFVAIASKTVREGSKMPRADWGFLQQQKFLVPPDEILEELSDVINPIASQVRALSMQMMALARARNLLLPRLMSGEIEV